MFMQIRKGMSEEDGQQYYALVNLADTEITRMASDYSDNELELFRKAMDLIVESENGMACSTDILNLADKLQSKKMKKKEVEGVLQRLVVDKWLCEKNGEYTLSTRCIMEMEQYIRNMYQDLVKLCNICHNIAIQGLTKYRNRAVLTFSFRVQWLLPLDLPNLPPSFTAAGIRLKGKDKPL
ncbi:UNVERIFIED_CONTAM: hypothetical protein FKN15_035199 [Acipenser sinensis]